MAALRAVDAAAHEVVLTALPRLTAYCGHEAALAEAVDLTAQIATEAPDAARVFAERLYGQPEMMADAAGVRRWTLHGLQRHRNDAAHRIDYFRRNDPRPFFDQRARNDSDYLMEHRGGLIHYLAGFGIAQQSVDLHEPQDEREPAQAPTADKEMIRLPRRLDVTETGQRDLLARAMLAHIAAHLRHSPLARMAGNRRPMLLAMIALIEDARVERLMAQEYPGLHAVWSSFFTASKEASGHDLAGLMARLARALHDPTYSDTNTWVRKGRELFEEAAARDLRDVDAFDYAARQLSIDIGRMHLSLPIRSRPTVAYRDDNALLWSPDLALPVDEAADGDIELIPSAARDDPLLAQDLSDLDLRPRYVYQEWDHRLEALREDWTTVFEQPRQNRGIEATASFTPPTRTSHHGARRTPDRSIRLTRQAEGDEIDMNAMVENVVQQRSGLSPDGRIFCHHSRRRRSTAVVLLMDLSTSTNRFVPGSFTKVIDLEKQAAVMVAEMLDAGRDRVAVHGFSSNGRHEVNYRRIKNFDEPFGPGQRAELAALTSGLSTRMGAALRHATTALAKETTDTKVILLLTDGEPSDIDVVEENYLVEDAREAVARAAARRVRTFCLTLDRRADRYVRRIFGARNFLIVERASAFTANTNNTLMRLLTR